MAVVQERRLPLFDYVGSNQAIINVSTVPQRSPFRYPGGKTWLIPYIRQWLTYLPLRPAELIEPFAGGAIVGLTVAAEQFADHVTLVELDAQVAAVWHTILEGDAEWLANRICAFDLTPETVAVVLSQTDVTLQERAFQTIVKNRINRGGILAPGAGKLKYGDGGKGIKSRWYPETLRRRILDIARIRERITFIEGDSLQILQQTAHCTNTAFFIDPPYTAAGKKAGARLYTHFEIDHEKLFEIVQGLRGDFLMTYEDAEGVRWLAQQHGFETRKVAMKNTHHATMTELLIGRDLRWLDV